MKIKPSSLLLSVGLFALVFLTLNLFGQTNAGVVPTDQDIAIRDALSKFSAFKLFLIPIITVLIMAARKWIPLIPDQLWPWLAPFIGAILDWAAARAGFWTGSVEAGAALGGLSVWFSQIGKQTKEAMKQGFSHTVSGKSNLSMVTVAGLSLLMVGCSAISPATVQSGSKAIVSGVARQYPSSVPAIRSVVEAICETAGSTNTSPTGLVANINATAAGNSDYPGYMSIVTGLVVLYEAAWNSAGGSKLVDGDPVAKAYLEAICQGGNSGLPASAIRKAAMSPSLSWPLPRLEPEP